MDLLFSHRKKKAAPGFPFGAACSAKIKVNPALPLGFAICPFAGDLRQTLLRLVFGCGGFLFGKGGEGNRAFGFLCAAGGSGQAVHAKSVVYDADGKIDVLVNFAVHLYGDGGVGGNGNAFRPHEFRLFEFQNFTL